MPLGADDLKPGLLGGEVEVLAEFDVGTPARHVGRDRDRAFLARPRDDFGFSLVILGVQHLVPEPLPLEHLGQGLRHIHRRGADQDRQAELVEPVGLLDHRVVFLPPGLVDPVGLVLPDDRLVGRNDRDVDPVDRVELRLFGLRGAGHARQLVVHPEVVLDGDRGEGLGLALDLHPLLGLHRLVQPVGPATARQHPAGELVHDEHLAVLHQVIDVLLVERVGLEQLVDDMKLFALGGVLRFHLLPGGPLFRDAQVGVPFDPVHRLGNIGHQEQGGIVG